MDTPYMCQSESPSPKKGANKEIIEKKTVDSFILTKLLGKGSFGEVFVAEDKVTGEKYAMKIIEKTKIIGRNLIKYALTEKKVLASSNHPFIVKLRYSFQSSDLLFLVMDYCPGGDLSHYLSREGRFSEEKAKIYICEVVLALEHLHKQNIIYRDLKPENIVLDKDGHALLTDFGLAKEGISESELSRSFCGSLAYLAPEVLGRRGHGKAVDWYHLGVLLHELLTGQPPYFSKAQEELFKNIRQGRLEFPAYVSEKARSLIEGVINFWYISLLATYKKPV